MTAPQTPTGKKMLRRRKDHDGFYVDQVGDWDILAIEEEAKALARGEIALAGGRALGRRGRPHQPSGPPSRPTRSTSSPGGPRLEYDDERQLENAGEEYVG
jgi:hypothetical protein